MLQVGDTIFGDRLVILEIRDNYRTFIVRSVELGDQFRPFEIKFDAGRVEDDITRALRGGQ